MTRVRGWRKSWLLAAAGMLSVPVAAEPSLPALSTVESGLWELRASGDSPQRICVANPVMLLQLRHHGNACGRLVLASEPTSVTVHYNCPHAGWGRTTLKVVTPRALRIESQGIADNAPFALNAEARRLGDCPSAKGASPR